MNKHTQSYLQFKISGDEYPVDPSCPMTVHLRRILIANSSLNISIVTETFWSIFALEIISVLLEVFVRMDYKFMLKIDPADGLLV